MPLQGLNNDEELEPDRLRCDEYVIAAEWKILKARCEDKLRVLVFRYPKPTTLQIFTLCREAIGVPVADEDAYMTKLVGRCMANVASWKNCTLKAMEVHVTAIIEADLQLGEERVELERECDTSVLYRYFSDRYAVKDAETVFSYVSSKWRLDYPRLENGKYHPVERYTRDFFANLATMVKMHISHPRGEETDRKALLQFYDDFGKKPDHTHDSIWADVELKLFKRVPSLKRNFSSMKFQPAKKPFGLIKELVQDDQDSDQGESIARDQQDEEGARNNMTEPRGNPIDIGASNIATKKLAAMKPKPGRGRTTRGNR